MTNFTFALLQLYVTMCVCVCFNDGYLRAPLCHIAQYKNCFSRAPRSNGTAFTRKCYKSGFNLPVTSSVLRYYAALVLGIMTLPVKIICWYIFFFSLSIMSQFCLSFTFNFVSIIVMTCVFKNTVCHRSCIPWIVSWIQKA